MNAQELYDEWTSGETSGVRPQRVKKLREDIRRHTGMYVPRRIPEIESWQPRMKGQITKKLRIAAEEEAEDDDESGEAGEPEEPEGTEGEVEGDD